MKIISIFLLTTMFVLTPLMPTAAAADPMAVEPTDSEFADLYELSDLFEAAGYYDLVEPSDLAALKPCPSGTFRVRRNTRTKKKLVHSLIAGGIGAAIGGGIGGGRGALVGLGSGAGGYLVYRYVRDRRGHCVPRRVRG